MFALLFYAGLATAQVTQSGCNCKSSTEVKWRLAGGKIGGGFSHYGCGTGPYEDRAPAQGRNWCDTQQSSCNGGQGWDFCNAPAPTPKSFKGTAPQEVNVNLGAVQQGQSTGATSNPGVTLSVNLNLGSSGSSGTPGAITTVQGCTCHPTSEVIMMQNGVRVGGGFSHTGCGTGPYEAYSPGKGSPWCDTVETWCASGWDLCVPPAGTSTTTATQTPSFPNPLPPQTPSYTANYNTMNSFTTAFGSTGSYQVPPTPFTMPPTPFVFPPTPPLYQAPLSPGYTEFPSSSAYTPPGPNNFNSNSYTSNSYTPNSYTSPAYTGTPSYTNTISNFNSNPSSYNAYTPVSAPVAGPAYSPPSYNSASSYTSSSYTASASPAYTGSSYTPPVTTTRVTSPSTYASAYSPPASNFASTSTSVNVVPVPVARATATTRSPFANQRYPQRPGSRLPGKGLRGPPRGGRGMNDYDYDDPSSSSSILPLMLMSKATGASTSSSLLPLMLATQSGGNNNNNMLPMMMMMQGSSGSTGLSSSLTQLMMFNALRREGDGEAQNTTTLGEIGQELGFTRAVVSSGVTAADDTAEAVEVQGGGGKVADDKEETDESDKGEEEHQEDKEEEEEDHDEEEEDAAAKEETDTTGDAATAPTASAPTAAAAAAVVAASPTAAAPTPADTTATTTPVDTRTLKGRKGPPASSDSSSSSP